MSSSLPFLAETELFFGVLRFCEALPHLNITPVKSFYLPVYHQFNSIIYLLQVKQDIPSVSFSNFFGGQSNLF